MTQNIAAIHLITANANIGSPVLSGSILIFGGKKAREDFVISNWLELLEEQGDDFFSESNRDHILTLINSGAEIIDEHQLAARILGCQARYQTTATIWQNHYDSHVSHYAYLWALTMKKRDVMLKGFNFDGNTLNAANRFVAECEKNVPTAASSPESGLYYLKTLYIGAKKLLGHDIDSDGAKILKEHAPSLAPAIPVTAPALPPQLPAGNAPALPVSNKVLTPPSLPPMIPALPQ